MADYEREARDWLAWVERATKMMKDQTLPSSVSELHNLIHELEKFKADDLPPKYEDKQRLAQLYAELEVTSYNINFIKFVGVVSWYKSTSCQQFFNHTQFGQSMGRAVEIDRFET
jgi:hypothetical protein